MSDVVGAHHPGSIPVCRGQQSCSAAWTRNPFHIGTVWHGDSGTGCHAVLPCSAGTSGPSTAQWPQSQHYHGKSRSPVPGAPRWHRAPGGASHARARYSSTVSCGDGGGGGWRGGGGSGYGDGEPPCSTTKPSMLGAVWHGYLPREGAVGDPHDAVHGRVRAEREVHLQQGRRRLLKHLRISISIQVPPTWSIIG